MNSVQEILKAIKKLPCDEREMLIFKITVEEPKKEKNVFCKFCGCKLLMGIEKEHKKCWDCHYEGKGL